MATTTHKLLQQVCPMCRHETTYRSDEPAPRPFCIYDGARLLPARELEEVAA